ncbi:MAG: hypothetical protein ACRDLM_04160 [Gaiellaceae bacterium]
MGVSDWWRRLFSPSTAGGGEDVSEGAGGSVIAGGVSGFAALEDAQAAEDELEQFEQPPDSAP